ncbi:hypothetical protein [Streptomyces sp. NRRL S-495]|uniref:hypothetical protein n=1 Tax=Streptomyces sp. NRRL S-495 TaxID=1609133 RepID=UPI0013318184|nr:hypothetical protein [Streptomyces sp. NRRL S-495]
MVACASHLTPAEWAACQEARARAGAESAARWAAQAAARDEQGQQAHPAPAVARRIARPCTGGCISQERAWGRDADSASSLCAACDGYVCLMCGQVEVDGILDICGECEEPESWDDEEPDTLRNDEIDTGPEPRMRLNAMVNQLVTATGTTHRDVNARINRIVGVHTRAGADEQVIRRAARVARDWLDRLPPSPQTNTAAPPDVPDPGTGTVHPAPTERTARDEGAVPAGGRVPPSAPADTVDGAAEEHTEMTVTVRLADRTAGLLRRRAEIQQRPIEEIVAECISNEMRRDVHEALYNVSDTYAATIDALAEHLALVVREPCAPPPAPPHV